MPVKKLKDFLDQNGVKYVTISHSQSYTAQEIAASAHIPGQELAKVVMITIDGKMAMAVLPASRHIDFDKLREVVGKPNIRLSTEMEFKDRFPECEVGAMPPFGNLWDMPVYVAEALTVDEEIAFNAGSHVELIRMRYKDFERLAQPKVGRFAA